MTEAQTPTNWPNPERPGVPMFPDLDGKHIIDVDPEGQKTELVYYWIAIDQVWVEYEYEGPDDALEGYDLIGWVYVGTCLTPNQISEMLAGERERCAVICESLSPRQGHSILGNVGDSLKYAAKAIRNLGAAS